MPYAKQIWVNEVPTTDKFKITATGGSVLEAAAGIEPASPPSTAGSPLNAERMSHIETGIEAAQAQGETAAAAAATADAKAVTADGKAVTAQNTANAAIPKTLTAAIGDIIYASAANTPARRLIGTTGQVLTVTGGVPTWETSTISAKAILLSGSSLPSAESGTEYNTATYTGSWGKTDDFNCTISNGSITVPAALNNRWVIIRLTVHFGFNIGITGSLYTKLSKGGITRNETLHYSTTPGYMDLVSSSELISKCVTNEVIRGTFKQTNSSAIAIQPLIYLSIFTAF